MTNSTIGGIILNKNDLIKALKAIDKLIIFRKIRNDKLLNNLKKLLLSEKNNNSFLSDIIYKLVDNSVSEGIEGDIWHNYLKTSLISTENAFSLNSEKKILDPDSSLYKLAANDLKILNKLFEFSFADLLVIFKRKELIHLAQFKISAQKLDSYRNNIYAEFYNLALDNNLKLDLLINFYKKYGTGILNQSKAFYWSKNGLQPAANPDPITFANLISYQNQRAKLIENTESFLNGYQAHNVLLYGDSGTGKSSSVKALLNKYYPEGLRLVEINSNQIKELPAILAALNKRGLKFIIFMDDLSFGEFETDYKYLKAVMEGGIESKPENVLFYATSNRRHLVKEKWQDRESEVHKNDILNEKLSLAERFGLTLMFKNPVKEEYLTIVKELARQEKIEMETEILKEKALKWSLWNKGRSGRSARQFIDQLLKENQKEI